MPGDVLTKEELLLVEKMINNRVPDIDSAMEKAFMSAPLQLSDRERRLWARNKVLAEVLGSAPFPVEAQDKNDKVNLFTGERSGVKAAPVKAEDPKESSFDVKPRVFTLGEEEQ